MNHTSIALDSQAGRLVERLAYAGLIPFVLLAWLMWIVTPEAQPFVTIALCAYGAVVSAFLGGIHWGIGLRHDAPERKLHMVWGVVAACAGWIALIMPAYAGLPILALLLIACYLVDRKTWPPAGLRAWMTLRFRLTVVSTLACLLGAAAT